MKQSLDTLWQETLLLELQKIEEQRKKKKTKILFRLLFAVSLMAAALMTEFDLYAHMYLIPLVLMGIGLYGMKVHESDYDKNFKEIIFSALPHVSDLNWSYRPRTKETKAAAKEAVSKSKLFARADKITCDDSLEASIDGKSVHAFEFRVAPRFKRHHENSLPFNGILAVLEVSRPFTADTFVITSADDTPVSEDDVEQPLQPVELEWVDFERFLSVYSSDQSSAREIFTPDFMEVLYDWWKDHDKNLRLSFIGSHIYIALPTIMSFEPDAFVSTEHQKSEVKKIYDFIDFLEETMQLVVEENGKRL